MPDRIVVALFENRGAAEAACRELEAAGIDRRAVSLIVDEAATGSTPAGVRPDRLTGFAMPLEEAHSYAERVRRGEALLVVEAEAGDASRIEAAMERHGPIELDDSPARPDTTDDRYGTPDGATAEVTSGGVSYRPDAGTDDGPRLHATYTTAALGAAPETGGRSGADTGAGTHPLAGRAAADVDPATGGLGPMGAAGGASPSRSRVRTFVHGPRNEPSLAGRDRPPPGKR